MNVTTSNLLRLAGLSAMVAGISFVAVGLIHPPNTFASVSSGAWATAHIFAIAMSIFGLLGITGIYARQVEESGWLGLAGFLLFSLWLMLAMGFTFAEAFILPLLAVDSPTFVQGFVGIFSGTSGDTNVGALATLWSLTGVLYLLGGLLFGVATLRAGILSRWAAGTFGFGAVSSLAFALLPRELEMFAAIPVGVGLAWLGYALWSERREPAAAPLPSLARAQLRQAAAE